MAVDDLNTLRIQLPDLFVDHQLPESWDEEFVFVPVDKPEAIFDERQDRAKTVDDELFDFRGTSVDLDEDGPPRLEPIDLGPISEVSGFAGAPVGANSGSVPPPDALAFYLPYHYFHPTWWGVYLVAEGVEFLARYIQFHADGVLSYFQSITVARVFLYNHEVFHHNVEVFATRLELSHRTKQYRTAFQAVFQRTIGTDKCLEEAIASAHAIRRVKKLLFPKDKARKNAAREALEHYIRESPPGYRRALEFVSERFFDGGRFEFAEVNFRESFPHLPQNDPEVWILFPQLFRGISNINSRVNYLVNRTSPLASRADLGLRYLSYKGLAKRLRRLAHCEHVRSGKGSHEIWQRPDGRTFAVPRHSGDLKKGTLLSIIRESGLDLSESQFISEKV